MPRLVVILLILLGMVLSRLSAQAPCDSASTQAQLTRCAADRSEVSARRLRQLLTELAAVLDSSRAAELNRVQALWLRFREAHCKWDSEIVEGGSMQPMWYSDCVADLAEARIADLKHALSEGGGDCEASRKYDLVPRDTVR
jgi:uncharacterized protein YecT (DUF1311 family)